MDISKPVKIIICMSTDTFGNVVDIEKKYFCPHCWNKDVIGVTQRVSSYQPSCPTCRGLLDWSNTGICVYDCKNCAYSRKLEDDVYSCGFSTISSKKE